MGAFEDLTGKTFGRLTVLSMVKGYHKKYTGCLCECLCGNQKIVRSDLMKNGDTKSCGCLQRENKGQETQNGLSGTRVYDIWCNIIDRCHNSSCRSYHNYGGRGIKVCNEWLEFGQFYNWSLSNGYAENLTIERKDVNGNYEPLNCTWIPKSEQNYNKRTTHNITINGITKPMALWAKENGISLQAMYYRIKNGWTGEDLLKPVKEYQIHKLKINS